jgi:nucleoside-diphosphate-sugar epimerase
LVTGAGGFVGSAVTRELVSAMRHQQASFWDGAAVEHVVAVLRPEGSLARLEELGPSDEWSVEYADLTVPMEARALLRRVQPRAVLHLAVDRQLHQELAPEAQQSLYLAPLETLVTALAEVGGERFIHTSSVWVLPAGAHLDETSPLEPRLPYAHVKARADALLPLLGQRTGVPWINLRLFNMFGRYEAESRLLPYLADSLSRGRPALLSSGEHIRDYTDVDDVARAYRLALRADTTACDAVYHVGSGSGTRIRDFAWWVAEQVGDPSLIHFGAHDTPDQDCPVQVANPSKARQSLGWEAQTPARAGIERTVDWWLARWGRPSRAILTTQRGGT